MSAEIITWHDARNKLPDMHATVLVRHVHNGPHIWPGYHDGECWLCFDRWDDDIKVTHWADLPKGPTP